MKEAKTKSPLLIYITFVRSQKVYMSRNSGLGPAQTGLYNNYIKVSISEELVKFFLDGKRNHFSCFWQKEHMTLH